MALRYAPWRFASPTRASNVGFRRWVQGGDMNFVPMDELDMDMRSAGYGQIGGEMGRWVGYRWGMRDQRVTACGSVVNGAHKSTKSGMTATT